jgi:Gram-negative porin
MKKHLLTLLAAALCSASYAASGPEFKFSGFGTVGAVTTNTDETQFRDGLRQPRGADTSVDFGVDSRVAGQVNLRWDETFSAVGQVLASRRAKSEGPALEWLYGQAELPAGFSLKLGRMVLPAFMISDSRSVGYSQHWLRTPNTVYGGYPASSFDGGQLQYRGQAGPVNLTAQLSVGKAKADIVTSTGIATLDFPKIRSLNLLAESGDWLFRLGTVAALESTLTGLPPMDDRYNGVGVQYDNGTLVVLSEYSTRRQSIGLFDSSAMYISAGWRFGPWTPYLIASRFKPEGPGYGPTAATANGSAIGLRWDAMPNVAVKAQFDRMLPSSSAIVNTSPAFLVDPQRINVYSVAVDFTF